jgi:hypothetical protein
MTAEGGSGEGPRVEGDDILEIVRTQAPPRGFEPFATAMAELAQGPQRVFGTNPDPLRPAEIVLPMGGAWAPPHCPLCFSLIQAIRQNHVGDMLFECLYDGYAAVFRVGPQRWEARGEGRWRPPLFGNEPPAGWTPPTPGVSYEQAAPAPASFASAAPIVESTPIVESAAVAATVSGPSSSATDWLTLAEAAAVSGKSANAIYKLVRRGVVGSRKNERGLLVVDMDALARHEGADG